MDSEGEKERGREGEREDRCTVRQNQNQRSIHLEMHKERSSKETNKVGGSFRKNRGRVKGKKN